MFKEGDEDILAKHHFDLVLRKENNQHRIIALTWQPEDRARDLKNIIIRYRPTHKAGRPLQGEGYT